MTIATSALLDPLMTVLHEPGCSSGSYMPLAHRVLLMGLALSLPAQDILETGTSSGGTALAFALTGAHVVTIDHDRQHPDVTAMAVERLRAYPNVERVHAAALFYLLTQPAESFDMVLLDDGHWPQYMQREIPLAQRVLRPGGLLIFHDTQSCHMWDVIEATCPVTWHRLNLPSWQAGASYTGAPTVVGQDFGLGVVRKPFARRNPMENFEQLEALGGRLPKIPYDMWVAEADGTYIDASGIDALIDYHVTVLEAWRLRPALVSREQIAHAHQVMFAYGHYCAQRADEAMRRKFERLTTEEENEDARSVYAAAAAQ